jgi:hypothetical protein
MTGPTLSVDSTAIRLAARIVDEAAAAFAGSGSIHHASSPLADGSLGHSEAARAVVVAAGQQLARAQLAAVRLAERSHTMAGAMQTSATFFEMVDSAIGAPR